MRFDLADLRLFLAVAEAGSITAGAQAAHLSLAAASERIRGMEDTLGTALLVRARSGARPTPAGEAVAHHARLVLRQIEHMRGELADYAHGLKGHVRLLANTAALCGRLPEQLAAFLVAHPGVDLDLKERTSQDIVPAIAQGMADLGIVSDAADTGGLACRPYGQDHLCAVLPPDDPRAGRPGLAFAELLGTAFVGMGEGSALQAMLAGHAERAGRPLKLRVEVRGFETVCRMVAAGVGIAVMPAAVAGASAPGGRLAVVPLTDRWALRNLVLCLRPDDPLPAYARLLADHLAPPGEGKAPPA